MSSFLSAMQVRIRMLDDLRFTMEIADRGRVLMASGACLCSLHCFILMFIYIRPCHSLSECHRRFIPSSNALQSSTRCLVPKGRSIQTPKKCQRCRSFGAARCVASQKRGMSTIQVSNRKGARMRSKPEKRYAYGEKRYPQWSPRASNSYDFHVLLL